MASPLRLISTDFDGTIHSDFDRPPVSPAFERSLAAWQARGAKWVINTGRDHSSLMEALTRARLKVKPDYLVLVEREIHVRVGERFEPLAHWNERCARDHQAIFARIRPEVPGLVSRIRKQYDANLYEDPWSPLCLLARSTVDADSITAFLEAYCQGVPGLGVMRNDVYARFYHVDYHKGSALSEIARLLQVPKSEVFAAGDHVNDLPMLRNAVAEWLLAPSNAVPDVKAAVRREGGRVSLLQHGHAVAEELDRIASQ